MFKNKLFNMALIIIIAITLLGVVSFVLWQTYLSPAAHTAGQEAPEESKPLTAQEIQNYSVDTDKITTNLLTNNIYIARFTITADSNKGKDELTLRLPQIKSIIIKTLNGLSPEDLKGTEGINKLEAKVMNEVSAIMVEGKIVQVITTEKIMQ